MKKSASVTVFLSLTLLVLISLCTVTLESAHMMAVRSHIAQKSDAAMSSLLSRYDKELYERFRLFAFRSELPPDKLLKKELEDYDDVDYLLLKGSNFLLSDIATVEVPAAAYQLLTDDDCEAFLYEVKEIVTADLVNDVKAQIEIYINSLSAYGKITEYTDRILEKGSELTQLLDDVKGMYKDINFANSKKSDLEKAILELLELEGIYDSTVDKESWDNVRIDLIKISDLKDGLSKAYDGIAKKMKSYLTSADQLNKFIKDMMKDLKKEDIEEPYKSKLYEQLESISDFLANDGYFYDGIVETLEASLKGREILEGEKLPEWAKVKAEDITDAYLGELLGRMKKNVSKLVDLKLENLRETETENSGLSGVKLIKTVKQLITNGSYSLFVDNLSDLSKRNVNMKEYPSKQCGNSLTQIRKIFSSPVSAGEDMVSLNYYLYRYLDCYGDGSNYDLEYVLGQKSGDKENLKSTLDQLLMLRQIANVLYLFTDSEKKAQAKAAATATLAITGNIFLIEAFSTVILTAWAFAEAVLDMRKLLAGERISFLKDRNSFTLTLENALDPDQWMKSGGKQGVSLKSNEKNAKTKALPMKENWKELSYKQYLFLLLFFHLPVNNAYRGLDMIQWNMQQYDPKFLISHCIYSLTANMEYYVQPVFLSSSPFEKKDFWGRAVITHQEKAAYGD